MALNLSLPKDKPGQQKLLLGLLPFLVFFAYYQFMHGDKKAEIGNLETRLEELEMKNRAAQAIAMSGGPELAQKLALYEQHMVRLEELIPKSEEVAMLLNSLAERAIDTNVDLSLMRPEASDEGEFYVQQTYQIQVIGRYHEIGRYLASIASGPRIVTPVQLRMTVRLADGEQKEGAPRLNADFRIMTYVIPSTPTLVEGGQSGGL